LASLSAFVSLKAFEIYKILQKWNVFARNVCYFAVVMQSFYNANFKESWSTTMQCVRLLRCGPEAAILKITEKRKQKRALHCG
jgi:hypothetical protein